MNAMRNKFARHYLASLLAAGGCRRQIGRFRLSLAIFALVALLTACSEYIKPDNIAGQLEEPVLALNNIYYTQRDNQLAVEVGGWYLDLNSAEATTTITQQLRELQNQRLQERFAHADMLLSLFELGESLSFDVPFYTWDETMHLMVANNYLLSVVVEAGELMQLAARSQSYRFGYTFDATTGQRLSLTDFWGEDAKSLIVAAIYAQIGSEERANFNPSLGADLYANLNENSWYTDGDWLYIIYNPHDVAAAVWGIIEFRLPRRPADGF